MTVTYVPTHDGFCTLRLDFTGPTDLARLPFLKAALKLELAGLKRRGVNALKAAHALGFKGDRALIVRQIEMALEAYGNAPHAQ